MKPRKMLPLVLSMAAVSILFILLLSYISFADDTSETADTPETTETGDKPETAGTQNHRLKPCIECCIRKHQVCINLNPDTRLCAAENENCVATCKSKGATPSSWSDCWTPDDDEDSEVNIQPQGEDNADAQKPESY